MHFGATLRLLRLDSGLSLRDLARRLNVSGAYLSRVENGLDSVPTAARLEAIARELDIPGPVLMGIAHRVSPLVVDYVQREPDAGTLFLEIAHRGLTDLQLAEVRNFLDEQFPIAKTVSVSKRCISELLAVERIVLGLSCMGIDDVLDVAAGRLAEWAGKSAASISVPLKARERESLSAIGGGVAVPCVYLEGVALAAVVVTLAEPLHYGSPDGLPLRAVVVLAGPRNSGERRLILAQLARLTSRGLADQLSEADRPEELLSRLALLDSFR